MEKRFPRPSAIILWAVVLFGLSAAPMSAQTAPTAVGQWSGVTQWPIVATHTHMLPTGQVLFGFPRGDDARLWDPVTDTITTAAQAGFNVFCTGHSFLADGRLLVTGGHIAEGVGLPYASIYDPFINSWTRLPDMSDGRWYPTNTTLANGDVLVVSGDISSTAGGNPLPQVWETATGTWRSLTNAQLVQPWYPSMLLAPNGKVFNAGPEQTTRYLDTSGHGAWTTVVQRNFGSRDYGTSALYDDGKVLIVGGGDPPTATAEVIDLNGTSPTWRYVGSMAFPRRQHNATLLPDGKVLVTGGTSAVGFDNPAGAVFEAEMWDPATETWTTMAGMQVTRTYHSTALLLPDGRVLSAGGGKFLGVPDYPDAEIFSPPYLFKGARPTITSAPSSVTHSQTFFVETPEAASIAQVTWARLSSVTHSFNQNQRINRLSFSPTAGGLNIVTPSNANLSPPGHYMLFILNGNGVPSVAKIIRLDGGLTLDPVSVIGGNSSTGTVPLSGAAPVGGAVVALTTSNAAATVANFNP